MNTSISDNKNREFFVSHVSGSTKSCSAMFSEEATSIITSHFQISDDIKYILGSSLYHLLVISIEEKRTTSTRYRPVATLLYHYSPAFDVFCF